MHTSYVGEGHNYRQGRIKYWRGEEFFNGKGEEYGGRAVNLVGR